MGTIAPPPANSAPERASLSGVAASVLVSLLLIALLVAVQSWQKLARLDEQLLIQQGELLRTQQLANCLKRCELTSLGNSTLEFGCAERCQ